MYHKITQKASDYDLLIKTAQTVANNTGNPVGIIAFVTENSDHTGKITWEYTRNIEENSDRVVRIIQPVRKLNDEEE